VPVWALAIAYWLHMAATIVWIGGLFFQAAILAPAIARSLPIPSRAALLLAIRRRFEPLAWLSLAVLAFTGMTQMAANPHYVGFLQIHDSWSAAILTKHLLIVIMVATAAVQTWVVQPHLDRVVILDARGAAPGDELKQLLHRQSRLSALNLALGMIVLALTAVARSA
jgi:uncharacterized membrane protein